MTSPACFQKMIIGCVSGYNDGPLLEKCLISLKSRVDLIVYVDGAFNDFPHACQASDDESLNIAVKLADEIIFCSKAWEDEIQKRNIYLSFGKQGDSFLVLDGDEQLEGNLRELKQDTDLLLVRDDDIPPHEIFRYFLWRPGIRYEGTHNALWSHRDRLLNKETRPLNKEIKILHSYTKRSQERVQAKGIYYEKLKIKEEEFRKKYQL